MAGPTAPQEFLKAENVGLRMLLEQASIDAQRCWRRLVLMPNSARLPTSYKS
jgi:hypothetical protein